MSAKRDHGRRDNEKYFQYRTAVMIWLRERPPRWRLLAWRRWRKSKPVWKG